MDPEKYQKELFEFESPKKAKTRFGNFFSGADFAVTLTPEKMVFFAIGIIMLAVIFFALGVEKGKSTVKAKFASKRVTTRDIIAKPAIPVTEAVVPIVITRGAAETNIMPKNKPPVDTVKAEAGFDKSKPYTVIAAAFSREELALKEVRRLKMAGLEAFVYYGEPYYLACVGSFMNKRSADKILNKVRQMHRDAYVRLR